MDPQKLIEIRNALLREFGPRPSVSSCREGHTYLLYAHEAGLVGPRSLLPTVPPAFSKLVDAWGWPTLSAFGRCAVEKQVMAYRQFIGARFVWTELPRAQISLNSPAFERPAPTASDGGTLVEGSGRSDSAASALVRLPAPIRELRRLCLSAPGQQGSHAEIEVGTTEGRVTYAGTSTICLLGVSPWFRFELRPPSPGQAQKKRKLPRGKRGKRGRAPPPPVAAPSPAPAGAPGASLAPAQPIAPGPFRIQGDPWVEKIRGVQAVGSPVAPDLAKYVDWTVHETTTNTMVGSIKRFVDRDKRTARILRYHWGVKNSGRQSVKNVQGAFPSLSASRHLVVDAVLNVEGGPNALNTYDGPKLSWGMNQWTGNGELIQVLCYVYDFFPEAFERCLGKYGLGVTFTGRLSAWSPWSTYVNAALFRAPCCSEAVESALSSVGRDINPDAVHQAIAQRFRIDHADTASYAMAFVLYMAGLDHEVQAAQVQWTSYRITWVLDKYHRDKTVTNQIAIDDFLRSLRSSESSKSRLAAAENAISSAQTRGTTYPSLTSEFDDGTTVAEWRDWGARCKSAGKPTVTSQPRPHRPKRSRPRKPRGGGTTAKKGGRSAKRPKKRRG